MDDPAGPRASVPAASGRSLPAAAALAAAACVLVLALASMAVGAQVAAASGEELYVDRLGCWNCHGKSGGGGAGPRIANTALPLAAFVRSLRLPRDTMPPFASALASDAELAILYRWLDGRDAVTVPPVIAFAMTGGGARVPEGAATAGVEIDVTPSVAGGGTLDPATLRYRLTLTQAKRPVVNHDVDVRFAGRDEWAQLTTGAGGDAALGVQTDAADGRGPVPVGLRVALPAGRYLLVIEAIDSTERSVPVVAGIGTALLKVE